VKEGSGNGHVRERSGNGPLFIEDPLGNLKGGGGLFTGDLETVKELCKWSVPVYGICVRGTWREGSFTGNSESYVRHVKEGLGNGACLVLETLCWEPGWRDPVLRIPRDVVEGSGNGAFLL